MRCTIFHTVFTIIIAFFLHIIFCHKITFRISCRNSHAPEHHNGWRCKVYTIACFSFQETVDKIFPGIFSRGGQTVFEIIIFKIGSDILYIRFVSYGFILSVPRGQCDIASTVDQGYIRKFFLQFLKLCGHIQIMFPYICSIFTFYLLQFPKQLIVICLIGTIWQFSIFIVRISGIFHLAKIVSLIIGYTAFLCIVIIFISVRPLYRISRRERKIWFVYIGIIF